MGLPVKQSLHLTHTLKYVRSDGLRRKSEELYHSMSAFFRGCVRRGWVRVSVDAAVQPTLATNPEARTLSARSTLQANATQISETMVISMGTAIVIFAPEPLSTTLLVPASVVDMPMLLPAALLVTQLTTSNVATLMRILKARRMTTARGFLNHIRPI